MRLLLIQGFGWRRGALGLGLIAWSCVALATMSQAAPPRPVKALIIAMFEPEGQGWIDNLKLTDGIKVAGLSPDYPAVHCNADNVCEITTGMGKSNAASSLSALIYSGKFDLHRAYFLIAGIAGIDPIQGTLGTAAWAHYLVDWDLSRQIDAREMPSGWRTGYFGIHGKDPTQKPKFNYHTEVYELDDALVHKAMALSKSVTLEDNDKAKAWRAHYAFAPANEPPKVTQCDTITGDTWWSGEFLGNRAREWVKLLTDGKATYCTTQQEDNASLTALARGAAAGLLDIKRVAVLRSGVNFDRPYSGETAYQNLVAEDTGGFPIATRNLNLAGSPLIKDIVAHWKDWAKGVPKE